jgi:hypothetical protein
MIPAVKRRRRDRLQSLALVAMIALVLSSFALAMLE